MHLHDQIPIRILHVLEADIAQNTGIVDQDIDAAECFDRRLDDSVSVLDTVVVGNRLAARLLDLVNDNISSLVKHMSAFICPCQLAQNSI